MPGLLAHELHRGVNWPKAEPAPEPLYVLVSLLNVSRVVQNSQQAAAHKDPNSFRVRSACAHWRPICRFLRVGQQPAYLVAQARGIARRHIPSVLALYHDIGLAGNMGTNDRFPHRHAFQIAVTPAWNFTSSSGMTKKRLSAYNWRKSYWVNFRTVTLSGMFCVATPSVRLDQGDAAATTTCTSTSSTACSKVS